MPQDKVAVVFGASGVSGWAYVNELLNDYPAKGVWSRVYALTNRPLSLEQSYWPKDDRLSIVSGIDLLKGSQEELESALKKGLPELSKVTHVFYVAYKAGTDLDKEQDENVDMFKRTATAMDRLCPGLEFLVLQTGAKQYGCHLLTAKPASIVPPLRESDPPLPSPFGEKLFYLPQTRFLTELARGKSWGWADPRPDIIVGFVPNQNFYSLGSALGIYLSLRREVDGEGAECPFPGTQSSWEALSHDSSADMIARQTLHVSLTPPWSRRQGEAFNVADERAPSCWREKWPALCSYFGLRGVKAPEDNPVEVRAYIKSHMGAWEQMEKKYGLQSGHADSPKTFPGFEYFLLTQFDFDRQYDMSKMYDEAGFTEERTALKAWGGVWDRMRKAKIIPSEFS